MAEAAFRLEADDFFIETSHLITEDDEPLDNPFQERQQALLADALYASWKGYERFVAFKNVGVFSSPDQKSCIVPDVLLTLNVDHPAKESRAYFVWEYGKPPDLVVEIVSKEPGGEERSKKERYAAMGVAYYVIYNPFGYRGERGVKAFQRSGMSYIDMANPAHIPELKLGVATWEGCYQGIEGKFLRFVDENGELLLTGQELAEKEHQRAEKEHQRAELMAEKLRELGVDPHSL